MGHALYPDARRLLITADGGGFNGSRLSFFRLAPHHLSYSPTRSPHAIIAPRSSIGP